MPRWLAWAPFVGVFIARISRGRTIREFILGVLLIPTVFTLIWMTIFGNSAIDQVFNQGNEALGQLANDNTPAALFLFLEHFPWSNILSGIAILMVVVFFVTSCDSGAMVVDMLCSNGDNNTPLWQRVYWAGSVGAVAAVLLLGGGLSALQTMTIASALPFAVVLLFAMAGLMKALRVEALKRASLMFRPTPAGGVDDINGWKERLHTIVDYPNQAAVERFIDKIVHSAMTSVDLEFDQINVEAKVSRFDNGILLSVKHGGEAEFNYAVYNQPCQQPERNPINAEHDQTFYRAEVHLSEGGQDYDIMGWSRLAVINDIVDQYHKHLHFLHLVR